MKKKLFSIIAALLWGCSAVFGQTMNYNITALGDSASIVELYADNGVYNKYLVHKPSTEIDLYMSDLTDADIVESEDDLFEANLWLPDPNTGIMPLDAVSNTNNNKVYVYGGRRVGVLDPATNNMEAVIDVSTHSSMFSVNAFQLIPNSNWLAFNESANKVYCATFSNALQIIDCDDNTLQTILMDGVSNVFSSGLHLDEANDFLYWYVNDLQELGKLMRINLDTYQTEEFSFGKMIIDLTTNNDGSRVFFSEGLFFGPQKLVIRNGNEMSNTIHIETMEGPPRLIHNDHNDLVYALTFYEGQGKIYGFDAEGNIDVNQNSPITQVFASALKPYDSYTNTENKLCYTGLNSAGNSYMVLYNCITNTMEAEEAIDNYSYGVAYSSNQDLFLMTHTYPDDPELNSVVSYSVNDLTPTIYNAFTYGAQCRKIVNSPIAGDDVAVFSPLDGVVFRLDASTLSIQDNYNIGMQSYLGCHNSEEGYTYFAQSESDYLYGVVSVYDNGYQHVTTVENVGKDITSIVYNEEYNKVFVACRGSNHIKVIDGETNQVDYTIQIMWGNPPRLITPVLMENYKDSVLVAYDQAIVAIDADNYGYNICGTFTQPDDPSSTDISVEDGRFYATYKTLGEAQLFYVDLHGASPFVVTNSKNFNTDRIVNVAYNGQAEKVYVAKYVNYQVADLSYDLVTENGNIPLPSQPRYLDVDPHRNLLYVKAAFPDIFVYDCKDNSLIPGMPLNSYGIEGMTYNEVNDKMYFHNWSVPNDTKDITVSIVDCQKNDELKQVKTGNQNADLWGFYYKSPTNTLPEIIHNYEGNTMYVANNGFSNATAIRAYTDIVKLENPINWISFPRMQRFNNDEYDLEPVCENINVVKLEQVDMFRVWHKDYDENYALWEKDLGWYHEDLINFQSTLGYQTEFTWPGGGDGEQPYIRLEGARLNPDTEVNLVAEQPNWVGYFIPESQYPWDAFPDELYGEEGSLFSIETQHWSMHREPGVNMPWTVTSKVTPIKYGDMLILRGTENTLFQWNVPAESEEDVETAETENYAFEEEAGYIPFYIATDSTSDIQEIAVKVNGECQGASVRNPGDTLVNVLGYILDAPQGATVEFETWSGYKSTSVNNSYGVYNPLTKRMEKRTIYAGEKQDYYLVSLKVDEKYELPTNVSHITCHPNPFTNEIKITMRINEVQPLWIEVYDMQGRMVKTVFKGSPEKGYFEATWNAETNNGGEAQKGVYFYQIRTNSGVQATGKIVKL